jgi:hypothetical protein
MDQLSDILFKPKLTYYPRITKSQCVRTAVRCWETKKVADRPWIVQCAIYWGRLCTEVCVVIARQIDPHNLGLKEETSIII